MIREYNCKNCDKIIERIEKYDDEPMKFCPQCNKKIELIEFSLSSFQLKGGGWYRDGYVKKNK